MKITEIKIYVINTGSSIKWIFVTINTDEGITGLSEVGSVYREEAQAWVIDRLKPYVIGENPLAIRKLFNKIYKGHLDVRGPGSLEVSALGALEVACWDILGKKAKMPLYALLGGKYNDKIRAYVHCEPVFPKIEHDPNWLSERSLKLVGEGFRYLKFDPFWFFPEGDIVSLPQLDRAEEKVKAVREAIGNDIELGIEIHAKYNLPSARKICKRIEKYNPWFFEEPVGSEDFRSLEILSRESGIPIASGERLCTRYAFKEMIAGHCVDIVQVDPVRAGGFIESLAVANMAEAYSLPVVVHNPYGPIYDAICTHFAAAISNLLALEFPIYYYNTEPVDLRSKIIEDPVICEESFIQPSAKPGLGVEIREEELRKCSKIIE